MIELYLISVLGSLYRLSLITLAISTTGFIIAGIAKLVNNPVNHAEDHAISCKIFKTSKYMLIVSALLSILVPSDKELYMIFGIGPIIDNIQESEMAKQLPDKTLQVLDKWCDSYLKSENKQN